MKYGAGGALGLARTWPQAAGVLPTPGTAFDWEGDQPLNLPLEDLVIYEMHVRGFTQDPSSSVSSPGVAALDSTLHILHHLVPHRVVQYFYSHMVAQAVQSQLSSLQVLSSWTGCVASMQTQ